MFYFMKKRRNKNVNDIFYNLGWLLLVMAVIFYFLITRISFFQNMPCWFRLATGLYCPGCGATRSFFLLLHGQLFKAVLYYPAMPYAAAVYLWFMISHSLEKLSRGKWAIGLQYRNLYLYIALGLIVGNWVIKNLMLLFA